LFSKPKKSIYYSPNFHRHVVCEEKGNTSRVLESFLWLDEAKSRYPKANVAALTSSTSSVMPMVAGGGLKEDNAYNLTTNSRMFYSTFTSISTETQQKHRTVIGNLESRLGSPFLDYFPESDHHWVRERILFLLAPSPKTGSQVDWPRAFCDGYGAGFSESQATTAILCLRHLMSMHPLDSSSKKPPFVFFYQQLKVQFNSSRQARVELDHWLTGACPTDASTFAFLNSLDVSWDQCRILLGAFSSSLLSFDLDPSYQFSRPVRRVLSEDSIHYLRMRLQLSPPEVFAMIKTHSRLSTYSAKTLKSHLDALQSKLCLKSEELRQIVVRTPSVLGVSVSKLDQRVTFLSSEGKCFP
jgi:hypothetical protein